MALIAGKVQGGLQALARQGGLIVSNSALTTNATQGNVGGIFHQDGFRFRMRQSHPTYTGWQRNFTSAVVDVEIPMPFIAGALPLALYGVQSNEALGGSQLIALIGLSGIASGEAVGAPIPSVVISPEGTPSGEAVGALSAYLLLQPDGAESGEELGALKLIRLLGSGGWFSRLTGTTQDYFQIGGPFGPRIFAGNGNPNGATYGNPGDLYLNAAGGTSTTLWVKESGVDTNTGWVAK